MVNGAKVNCIDALLCHVHHSGSGIKFTVA